jgi:hypothetical protein
MPENLKQAAIRNAPAKISRASSNAAVLAIAVILSGQKQPGYWSVEPPPPDSTAA